MEETGSRSLVADVVRMVAVIAALSVVVGAGVHGVSGHLSGTVPDAEFGYDYDAASGTLTITHEGGEALEAAALEVSGVDADCAAGEWQRGRVTADDACVLERVPTGRTVRVVWEGPPGRTTLDVQAVRTG